jgi:hypothetical protein
MESNGWWVAPLAPGMIPVANCAIAGFEMRYDGIAEMEKAMAPGIGYLLYCKKERVKFKSMSFGLTCVSNRGHYTCG